MKLPIITGISRESIEDLLRRRVRTFEIRSSHNLIAFSEIGAGDKLFVTDAVPPDVVPGLCGYIVSVRGVDIRMHRTSMSTPTNFEEREIMSGRIQLVVHSQGKVRDVFPVETYKPIYVEAIEMTICDAR